MTVPLKTSMVVATALIFATQAMAAKYTVQQISYPASVATYAAVINDAGTVGGSYTDASGGTHGFVLSNGTYTSFDGPDGPQTDSIGVKAISADGTLAGTILNKSSGTRAPFVRTPTGSVVVVPLDGSGGFSAINDRDIACGDYAESNTGYHFAFTYDTAVNLFAVPQAQETTCLGINNRGDLAGMYTPQGYSLPAPYRFIAATQTFVNATPNCPSGGGFLVGLDALSNTYGTCADADQNVRAYELTTSGNTIILTAKDNSQGITTLNGVNKYGRLVETGVSDRFNYPAIFTQRSTGNSSELIITDQPAQAYGSNKTGVLVGYAVDSPETAFSFTATPLP